MWSRIAFIAVLIVIFGSLLTYSQLQHEPLKVSGYIEAQDIRLGSRVGGRVAEVLADEGDMVKQGQVLVRLEPFDLNELLAAAKAETDDKQALLEKLKTGYRPEEIAQAKSQVDELAARLEMLVNGPRKQEIDAARAELQMASSQLELAQSNYKREKEVFEKGAGTQEKFDRVADLLREAESNSVVRENNLSLLVEGTRKEEIAQARASLAKATEEYNLMKSGFRKEDIAQAEAAVAAAKANVAAIEKRIDELSVTAPTDAIVEALELEPGDLMPPNAPMLTLIDPKTLWVRAYVPENHLNIQLGQKLPVTVDSYDQEFQGEITFIARNAEFTPNNVQTPEERSKQVFRIKVTLLDGLDQLRSGMAADVWLEPRK
ncbi:HlyD family efflux transporter periplasmic adaptor subunit [Blastopirellula sp. JC732]|uniref:HlyD family efflux transporter periplasmic adaptor subunit n=1 Tax=Blastopirellula sediminis TaxID=2894196 RepID=A0A9X1MN99_9BACT|nr:HlyD family efflux transporter periplasmic adaptor subunit [Blastopirellula sediminis]MCC9607690.1 HlyD family efflux transporter periplasmic adaptor subunit [Blastopirellula sediminis]MCC9629017.1 HlyD family efflux transporter periplasmic adaptor subunit [Blastopirellula sediminis]